MSYCKTIWDKPSSLSEFLKELIYFQKKQESRKDEPEGIHAPQNVPDIAESSGCAQSPADPTPYLIFFRVKAFGQYPGL